MHVREGVIKIRTSAPIFFHLNWLKTLPNGADLMVLHHSVS